ncbi:MAG: hypothetical protein J5851_03840 [Oscillospiraceae bacterium]|nr:hypothetical protein [Oscillospiraceae bacterium]
MKTLAELMQEVAGSEELQKELTAIKDSETLEAFFKKHDCNATAEEFLAVEGEGALSDEDAEAVAGGMNPDTAGAMIRNRILTYRNLLKTVGKTEVEKEIASEQEPATGVPVDIIEVNKKIILDRIAEQPVDFDSKL